MLFILTIVSFMIIQAPPGDFLTSYIAALQQSGEEVAEEEIEALKLHYGLDQPLYVQYFKWMRNIVLRGNFGVSLVWERPVSDIIWERMALTLSVASTALVFAWIIAIPSEYSQPSSSTPYSTTCSQESDSSASPHPTSW